MSAELLCGLSLLIVLIWSMSAKRFFDWLDRRSRRPGE